MYRWFIVFSFLVCAASQSSAHHSFTKYDGAKQASFSGTVSNVRFQNPHVFFTLVTANGTFDVETESTPVLRKRGLTDAVLKDGAAATVSGWRGKGGAAKIGLSSIKIGGKTFVIRGSVR